MCHEVMKPRCKYSDEDHGHSDAISKEWREQGTHVLVLWIQCLRPPKIHMLKPQSQCDDIC